MYIQYNTFKLIKNLFSLIALVIVISCNDTRHFDTYQKGIIELPSGEKLTTYLAIDDEQQILGLSNIKPSQFEENEAMLFFNIDDAPRQFWMPETFFNLDIIFLNKDLYVLDVHKDVQHFEKRSPDHLIPRSKTVVARHVLEIKADTELSKKIQPGMMLKWISKPTLLQIESKIHLPQ